MKRYLIIEFDAQTLRPFIQKVYQIETDNLESELSFKFSFDGFTENYGVIDLDSFNVINFGNTSKRTFGAIDLHSVCFNLKHLEQV